MFEALKTTKRLKDMAERLETVERDFKRLRLEWEDTYDRLRVLMQRIAKRAQRVDEGSPEDTGPAPSPETGNGPVLSPHHQTIQQKILERRRRSGVQ